MTFVSSPSRLAVLAMLLQVHRCLRAGHHPATAPTPVARVALGTPNLRVAVGDSIRLEARALDAAGRPIPEAKIVFQHRRPGPGRDRGGRLGPCRLGGRCAAARDRDRSGDQAVHRAALAARGTGARTARRDRPRPRPPRPAPADPARGSGAERRRRRPRRRGHLDQLGARRGAGEPRRRARGAGRGPRYDPRRGGGSPRRGAGGGRRGGAGVADARAVVREGSPGRRGPVHRHGARCRRPCRRRPHADLVVRSRRRPRRRRRAPSSPTSRASTRVTASLGGRSATATVTVARRDVRRPTTVVGSVVRKAFPTAEVWIHPNGKVAYLGTHLGGDRLYAIDVSDPANARRHRLGPGEHPGRERHHDDADGQVPGLHARGRRRPEERHRHLLHSTTRCTRSRSPSSPRASRRACTRPSSTRSRSTAPTSTSPTTAPARSTSSTSTTRPIRRKSAAGRRRAPTTAGRLHDIDVQDGLVYASYWNDGLVILDVGNGVKGGSPSNPQLVSPVQVRSRLALPAGGGDRRAGLHPRHAHRLAAQELRLHRRRGLRRGRGRRASRTQPSRAYGRLQVLDVSDLEQPKAVAWYEPEYGGVHNVWVAGDTLYMGAYNAGFHGVRHLGRAARRPARAGPDMAQLNTADTEGILPNAPMTWGVVVEERPGLRERLQQRALHRAAGAAAGGARGRSVP